MNTLQLRHRAIRAVRDFLDHAGFIEVTTPVMIAAPAPEPHIDCPACGDKFLRASPELQMKKLLAAGEDLIYQIGPCFREGEFGSRHRPEFTMLEWYRRGADYRQLIDDMLGMLRAAAAAVNVELPSVTEIGVRDAYRRFAGWDPWTDWDQDRFDYDMGTVIEPSLPDGLVVLIDYPPPAASLALIDHGSAQRWELYWNRLELANCFSELCNREEQSIRFDEARTQRRQLGEADYPIDGEFLDMLPLIGKASGAALGVDRMLMRLLGFDDIAAVLVGD